MSDQLGKITDTKRPDSKNRIGLSLRHVARFALNVSVALASCALLSAVWRITGDENRREAAATVRSLEQARTSQERIEAIHELVRPVVIDGEVVIAPLIRALADPKAEVRVAAVRSLGLAASATALIGRTRQRATDAIAALHLCLDDPEPAVRIAAVHAVGALAASTIPSGSIRSRAMIDDLSEMLDDPDATVRASTIASLGFAGSALGTDPPPALVAALDDASAFNRTAAATALTRFAARSGD